MTQIRLIAVDLDGTLIDGSGKVGTVTRRALSDARTRQTHIVVATGRDLHSALQPAREAHADYLVSSNGAVGFSLVAEQCLWAIELDEPTVGLVLKAIESVPVWPRVHTLDNLFITKSHAVLARMYTQGYGRKCFLVDDYLKLKRRAIMVGIAGTERAIDAACIRLAEELKGRATVCRGTRYSADVVAPGISKGSGVARLARSLGVNQDSVIAFGNDLNDIELLAWAGISFAVEGSPAEVIEAAGGRTISMEDGIGLALRHLIPDIQRAERTGRSNAHRLSYPNSPMRK